MLCEKESNAIWAWLDHLDKFERRKKMNLNMFIPEIQILEKIVRPLIVYFFCSLHSALQENESSDR
jgi:hypothetical protein